MADSRSTLLPDAPHALATAASRRFEQHRIADLARQCTRLFDIGGRFFAAGHYRRAGLFRQNARGCFRSQAANRFGGWSDEDDARFRAGRGESSVLAQEAVAGMDGLGPVLPGRFENPVHAQIAVGRRRRSDVLGFVGHANMQRAAIGIREDRDAANLHFAQRADDAHGDFATVGDQNPTEHAS